MSSVEQVARKFVRYHYGELLSAGEVKPNEKTGGWEAELFCNYPRIIRDDDKPEIPWIKVQQFRRLGKLEINRNLEVVSATPREELNQLVGDRLTLQRQRAESFMVRASATQFAKLGEMRHVLRPVVELVQTLLFRRDSNEPELSGEFVPIDPDMTHWYTMLERIGVITKSARKGGGYESGPNFIEWLDANKKNPDTVVSLVLSELIRQELPSLKSAHVIAQLDKHIRVDNSYYWQALDAGEAFHAHWESLRDRYISSYGKVISQTSFCSTLYELHNVDAIRQDQHGHFYANEDILKQMASLRAESPDGTFRRA